MAYLVKADIETHMPAGIINDVDNSVDATINTAIEAAISEMRGYLSEYDVTAILATTGSGREAVLLLFTKDIAVWHFIQLANPNIDMELRQVRYERAIEWLRGVQKGTITPNLPLKPPPDDTTQTGNLRYGSNTKRTTHY